MEECYALAIVEATETAVGSGVEQASGPETADHAAADSLGERGQIVRVIHRARGNAGAA